MTKLTFKLTRPARKFGGDRYEHELDGNPQDKVVIYVPQIISRGDDVKGIAKVIDVTFEVKE